MKVQDWAIIGLGAYFLAKWLGRGFQVGDPADWNGEGRFGRMIFGPGGAQDVKGKTLVADGPTVFDYAATSPPWSSWPMQQFTGTNLQAGQAVGRIINTYIMPAGTDQHGQAFAASNWVQVKHPDVGPFWVLYSTVGQNSQKYRVEA